MTGIRSFFTKLRDKRRLKNSVGVLLDESREYPLCVVRPNNPSLALESGYALIRKKDDQGFQDILKKQDYRFVGWAAIKGLDGGHIYVVDTDGVIIGDPEAGDSLVSSPDFPTPKFMQEQPA